mmetsp:Transcript_34865/g.59978  ORF Transcript_34865/g.59978 Transcript_34865/m.59978 type:complete len:242 (+) Transcript_34865:119-844(+)
MAAGAAGLFMLQSSFIMVSARSPVTTFRPDFAMSFRMSSLSHMSSYLRFSWSFSAATSSALPSSLSDSAVDSATVYSASASEISVRASWSAFTFSSAHLVVVDCTSSALNCFPCTSAISCSCLFFSAARCCAAIALSHSTFLRPCSAAMRSSASVLRSTRSFSSAWMRRSRSFSTSTSLTSPSFLITSCSLPFCFSAFSISDIIVVVFSRRCCRSDGSLVLVMIMERICTPYLCRFSVNEA